MWLGANRGPVVPPDLVPTLTEPFRRITGIEGQEKSPTGAGLGLSIAQSVSTAHGARLDVHSQPEGGLSITVVLRV